MIEKCEIIEQCGKNIISPPVYTRIGCRALIIEKDKILLSHEINTGVFLSPGGGLEGNESYAECCKREVLEETGYIVETEDEFVTVHEYYYDKLFISHYFPCKIIGKGAQNLTESEIAHRVMPEWVDIKKALEIFGNYTMYDDEEIQAQYLREFTVISKYLNK